MEMNTNNDRLSSLFLVTRDKMSKSMVQSAYALALVLVVACPQLAEAFPTQTWTDIGSDANGSVGIAGAAVTYTLNIKDEIFGSSGLTPDGVLSGPGANAALALLEQQSPLAAGYSYQLTRVVVTLSGTVAGTVGNNSSQPSDVDFQKSVTISDVAGLNGGIIYLASQAAMTVPANTVDVVLSGPTTLLVPMPDTRDNLEFDGSDLDAFWADTISMNANFPATKLSVDANGSGSFSQTISSTGILTVMYDFTVVPEPGSLSLLWLGCAALALRRRRPCQSECA